MARLVVPQVAGQGKLRAATTQGLPGDRYLDRLVKYIPAESVAFYTFVDKLLASHFNIIAGQAAPGIPAWGHALGWALLGLGVVLTPVYLWRAKLPGQPWVMNATLSTIAFVLWAYALGGTVFVLNGWYSLFLAGLLAPVFTFVAGALEPRPTPASMPAPAPGGRPDMSRGTGTD